MTGSDLSRRRVPRMTAISSRPGPLVWLTACVHGDEVSGVVIVQEVFRRLKKGLIRGQVHAFPMVNPLGFENVSRSVSLSSEDLNRSFPGNPRGTFGERIAHQIFETILATEPDMVMDLHNDWIRSIPYALLDCPSSCLEQDVWNRSREVAQQTGLCVIQDQEVVRKSLSYNFMDMGIPAITLEMGESYLVNEANVRQGVGAVWNVLEFLGMVLPEPEKFRFALPQGYGNGVLLNYLDRPLCSSSGVIRYMVRPGAAVRKGQNLARVVNAFGKTQELLCATRDALVLGHNDLSAAFPGMSLMAFGTQNLAGGDS